jgi:molybdate transport system ATP-binding protein
MSKPQEGQSPGELQTARTHRRMTGDRRPLIRLYEATLRIRDRLLLPGTCWEIHPGQNWVVTGPNGSGKTVLVRSLSGDVAVVRGSLQRSGPAREPADVCYVGFDEHRRLLAREERFDRARWFSGRPEAATTVEDLLFDGSGTEPGRPDPAPAILGVDRLLERPIRHLSHGEMRRVLIARALIRRPCLLVLDEPYNGLDLDGRHTLRSHLSGLMQSGIQIVLVTHRMEEIPPEITHCLEIRRGRVHTRRRTATTGPGPSPARSARPLPGPGPAGGQALIRVQNLKVRYGDITVLDGVNWTVRRGEHWALAGPNGAGKTTLLRMVAGDHPQAYANRIHLFGRRRGSGESIWEIKAGIGLVSSELQLTYCRPVTALEAVVSGFYDSIGLYRHPDPDRTRRVADWMQRLGIASLAQRRFDHLSAGQQRMVLLARAMVKSPTLLILDEPCQGLDARNREAVRMLIDRVVRESGTQIVYVTHQEEELPDCVSHLLRFDSRSDGSYTARVILPGSAPHDEPRGHYRPVPE